LKRTFKQWREDNDMRSLLATDLEKRIEMQFGKPARGGWVNFKLDY
jgi:hypothetical protein